MTVPIGVATYDIGTMTIADETPAEIEPAVADLPALTQGLTTIVANAS